MNVKGMTMVVVAMGLLVCGVFPAMAGEASYGDRVLDKATRGFVNTISGVIEIPKNVMIETDKSNLAVGLSWGLLKGVVQAVGRTTVGAIELVTFPVPNDRFIHPNLAWQPMEEETTYGTK